MNPLYTVAFRKPGGEWRRIPTALSGLQVCRLRESLEAQGFTVHIETVHDAAPLVRIRAQTRSELQRTESAIESQHRAREIIRARAAGAGF